MPHLIMVKSQNNKISWLHYRSCSVFRIVTCHLTDWQSCLSVHDWLWWFSQLFGVGFVGLCRMAAGCCGTKKQKLNNSSSIPACNGTSVVPNGLSPSNGLGMVALPEMCFFCFDVLYCHLYNLAPPKTPSFSNDA